MKIKELMGTRHNFKALIPPSWVRKYIYIQEPKNTYFLCFERNLSNTHLFKLTYYGDFKLKFRRDFMLSE